MPGGTTTTLTSLVRPIVAEEATLIKFVNREFFGVLRQIGIREVMSEGDTAFQWRVNRSTGNASAEVFTEGQGTPTAGSQTWGTPSLSYIYHRVIVQITGHAMDALRSHYLMESEAGAGNLYGEITGAMDDLEDLYSNTFLGSTNNGIQIAIDDSGTYAGLARATVTDWQSYERAGGAAAVTANDYARTWETVRTNDRGGRVDAIIAPWNQVTNYYNLVGATNSTAANRLIRYMAESGKGANVDVGWNVSSGLSFNNVPIYGCQDLTTTEILFLSNVDTTWLYVTHRPMHRRQLSINDDSEARIQLSLASTLVCLNPRRQGKMSNFAA